MTTTPDPQAMRERNAALAAQLRAERIKQRLTQPALALKSGIGVSRICTWENNHGTPGLTNLNRWAAGLGLEIAAIRPDEQSTAERSTAERDSGEAAKRLEAFCASWGNADEIECALLGGIARPLTLADLDAVLAERATLAARVAELEAHPAMLIHSGAEERQGDVQAVVRVWTYGTQEHSSEHAYTTLEAAQSEAIWEYDPTLAEEPEYWSWEPCPPQDGRLALLCGDDRTGYTVFPVTVVEQSIAALGARDADGSAN